VAHLSMVGHPSAGLPSPVNVVWVVGTVPLGKGAAQDTEARERNTTDAKVKVILKECM
jgi:hypothetical protein